MFGRQVHKQKALVPHFRCEHYSACPRSCVHFRSLLNRPFCDHDFQLVQYASKPIQKQIVVNKKRIISAEQAKKVPVIKRPQAHWNAQSLAMLGDSVYSTRARLCSLVPPMRSSTIGRRVTWLCCAEAQV
jgi:hypothetical protein